LGYDVEPRWFRLVVNDAEAERVRAIFQLYLQSKGLLPVVRELARRSWTTKSWVTRKGHTRGGREFTTTSLYRLLTNVTYLGKIKHKDEIHAGEHAAIVDPRVWRQVQDLLRQHGHGRDRPRSRSGALLQGLLRCQACDCAMTPSWSSRRGCRRYRYYVCLQALKRGRELCPAKALPAAAIEQFVMERLRELAHDPNLTPTERELLLPVAESATWDALAMGDQAALVRQIVDRVSYDGATRTVAITLRQPAEPDGVAATSAPTLEDRA
jgi:site-specific DNA recombinase